MSEAPAEIPASEAAPAAPAAEAAPAAPKLSLAVGESTPVDQAALDLILPAERNLHQLLLNLGAHTEKVHQEGLILQSQVHTARKQFEETIKAAGVATGLNFTGEFVYNYSQETRTFTRTK